MVEQREAWILPDSVAHLDVGSLYQAVAFWAVAQQMPVTITDISKAFAITSRSATDVMNYISRAAGDAVDADVVWVNGEGERQRKAIHIREVCPARFARRLQRRKVKLDREQINDRFLAALRAWFVSRKPGESIPEALKG